MNTTYTVEQAAAAFREGKTVTYTRGGGTPVFLQEIKAGNPKGQPSYGFASRIGNADHAFITKSPEASIREALGQGTREIQVAESMLLGTVTMFPLTSGIVSEATAEAAPFVPLGPNVTRKGKPVRVIATDLKHNQFPVVYVHVDEQDEGAYEHTPVAVNAHGSYLNDPGMPHDHDLVGHLPPEAVKPLEVWIKVYSSGKHPVITGTMCHEKPTDDERGYRLFREVLP